MGEPVREPGRQWRPVLTPARCNVAVEIAREVSVRLASRERVERAIAAAVEQTAFPRSVYWEPFAVAQGDAGLALMFSYVDACFPGEAWDRVAHDALARAGGSVENADTMGPGLFTGLSGVGLAGWSLARGGTRYQHLLTTLDAEVAADVPGLATHLATPRGVPVATFDAISGLAGVGAYLLCRRDSDVARQALERVLHALVALALPTRAGQVPVWFTPAEFLADTEMARLYPHGNLNCGLAHGIPGPLATMALASREGVVVEGMDEAIDRIATWLVVHSVEDQWGINWPTVVPVDVDGHDGGPPAEPSRAAWCYGSPGVARALWLAGEAAGRAEWCELAIEAMAAVDERPIPERRIDGPTFCHGVAGLLQITLRFAHDTGDPRFSDAARTLADQLLALCEPDSLLGFRSFEPGGRRVDQAGLLDGAPGVAMVLLAAATCIEPVWDRLFLLS